MWCVAGVAAKGASASPPTFPTALSPGPPPLQVVRPAGKMADQGFVANARGGVSQRQFSGSGADEDIVVSSARAYISALNKMISYISANQSAAALAASASVDEAEGSGGKRQVVAA